MVMWFSVFLPTPQTNAKLVVLSPSRESLIINTDMCITVNHGNITYVNIDMSRHTG
jgi:hypothetical protein